MTQKIGLLAREWRAHHDFEYWSDEEVTAFAESLAAAPQDVPAKSTGKRFVLGEAIEELHLHPITCPQCGITKLYQGVVRFCSECGLKFGDDSAAAPSGGDGARAVPVPDNLAATQDDLIEATQWLEVLYSRWEEGTECHEGIDADGAYLGKAFTLEFSEEDKIAKLLERMFPRSSAKLESGGESAPEPAGAKKLADSRTPGAATPGKCPQCGSMDRDKFILGCIPRHPWHKEAEWGRVGTIEIAQRWYSINSDKYKSDVDLLAAFGEFLQERPVMSTPNTAWLIERARLCLGVCEHRLAWVTFTNESAMCFSRQSDAYGMLEVLKWEPFKLFDQMQGATVTEHSWGAAPPTASPLTWNSEEIKSFGEQASGPQPEPTPHLIRAMSRNDVLQFPIAKRLMTEMREALKSYDVSRISDVYYRMFPDEIIAASGSGTPAMPSAPVSQKGMAGRIARVIEERWNEISTDPDVTLAGVIEQELTR